MFVSSKLEASKASLPVVPEIWMNIFFKNFKLEKDLHAAFIKALKETFAEFDVESSVNITDDSIADCVVFLEDIAKLLVEFKRSGDSKGETYELDLKDNVDQMVNYASKIMLSDPRINTLPIILTNGWYMYLGFAIRTNPFDFAIKICPERLCLYNQYIAPFYFYFYYYF